MCCSVNKLRCKVQMSLTLASAVFANCFAFSNLHALVKIERSRVRAGLCGTGHFWTKFSQLRLRTHWMQRLQMMVLTAAPQSVATLSLLLLFQFLIAVFGILHLAKRRDVWQWYPLLGCSNKCRKGIRIGFANIGPWIPYVCCSLPGTRLEPPSIWLVREVDISLAKSLKPRVWFPLLGDIIFCFCQKCLTERNWSHPALIAPAPVAPSVASPSPPHVFVLPVPPRQLPLPVSVWFGWLFEDPPLSSVCK